MQSMLCHPSAQVAQPLARHNHYHSPVSNPDIKPSSTTPSTGLLSMSNLDSIPLNNMHPFSPLTPPTGEIDKIQRNSLYLTFNAPNVDEYVSLLLSSLLDFWSTLFAISSHPRSPALLAFPISAARPHAPPNIKLYPFDHSSLST